MAVQAKLQATLLSTLHPISFLPPALLQGAYAEAGERRTVCKPTMSTQ